MSNIENMPTGGGDGGLLGFIAAIPIIGAIIIRWLATKFPALSTVMGAGRTAAGAATGAAPAVSRFARIGKFLKRVPWLGAALTGWGAYDAVTDNEANPELTRQQKDTANGSAIGGAAGGLGGAMAGGSIGMAAGPLGALAGAVIGYFGGEKVGDVIGRYAGDAFAGFRGSEMQAHMLAYWDIRTQGLADAAASIKESAIKLSDWLGEKFDDAKKAVADMAAPVVEQIQENANWLNDSLKEQTGFDAKDGYEKVTDFAKSAYGRVKEDWAYGMEAMTAKGVDGGSASKEDALKFFMDKGWSKEQSAGIVSNLLQESNLNPKAVGDGRRAQGIAQWHPDRQAAFAKQYGRPLKGSSVQDQLEFVHHELTAGNEQPAGNKLKNATTAKESGSIVSRYYERPSLKDKEAAYRGAIAEKILNGLQTATPQSISAPSPKIPTIPKAPAIIEAPPIMTPMASDSSRKGLTVTVDKGDVGQDLSDRKIALIATGGLSG